MMEERLLCNTTLLLTILTVLMDGEQLLLPQEALTVIKIIH
jgi:hypothetical protein